MGSAITNLRDTSKFEARIIQNFQNLKPKDKQYLTLKDILYGKLDEIIQIDFFHLGTLYCLDNDKDGRFSLPDIMNFVSLSIKKVKTYKSHQIKAQLQAYCTLILWLSVSKNLTGESDFLAWIARLLYQTGKVSYFQQENMPFIKVQVVKMFYQILNVRQTHNIELQSFIELLQLVSEIDKTMDLEDSKQDDYVPLNVIQSFSKSFLYGFSKLMLEIGMGKVLADKDYRNHLN